MSKMNFDKTRLIGYEMRCDRCNAFLPFNEQTIQAHYDSEHAGMPSNWRAHTDFTNIVKNANNAAQTTQFVKPLTAQDIEDDPDLSFMSADLIAKARSFADVLGARLYKFTSLADGHATKILNLGNGKTVTFDYFISADERKRAARSMFDKDVNINHYLYSPYFNFVVDAEDVNGKLVALVLIEDPLINEMFDAGLCTGNSVEYYRRNSACSCTSNCTCQDSGVIYVGWAAVFAPANPADATGEVLQRNFVEVTPGEKTRMLAQVQASAKANLTNRSYQRASEKDGKIDNTSGITANGSSCGCNSTKNENNEQVAANVSAEHSAQPDNTLPNGEVNNKMTNENKEVAELKSALESTKTEFTSKLGEMAKQIESLTKAMQSAKPTNEANADIAKFTEIVNEAIKPYKADMIEFGKKFDALNEMLTTGKGINRQPVTLTAEDFKAVLPAKVESMSLAEVVEATN